MPATQGQITRTQPIVRVRTGCLTCRRRKKKCDEKKPICKGCRRNKLDCEWPSHVVPHRSGERSPPTFDTEWCHTVPSDQSSYSTEQPSSRRVMHHVEQASSLQTTELLANDSFGASNGDVIPTPAASSGFSPNQVSNIPDELPSDEEDAEIELEQPVQQLRWNDNVTNQGVSFGLSLMPGHDNCSPELLQFYLSRTANSMGNGATELNPFIVQFIPIAFSNDLILQLLLAQSAVHRANIEEQSQGQVARNYYSKSLRIFRNSIAEFVGGNSSSAMMLAIGALIMCFTETAKGDVSGAFFSHLSAANSLLVSQICGPSSNLPEDIKNFLVEYYVYAATLSLISVDPRHSPRVLLTANLEAVAHGLVVNSYIGHLCGCWLELLLIIPHIFEFGRRVFNHKLDGSHTFPSADDIITYNFLQHQISMYAPAPTANEHAPFAGYVFQKGVMLYLLTLLGALESDPSGPYRSLIQQTMMEAVTLLESIPASSRINTSLCWPIAVIGSAATEDYHKDVLRSRLRVMFDSISLGNIKQTLTLLELIWELPSSDRSPWKICEVMQQHNIWISLA